MKSFPRWYFDELQQVGVDYTDIQEVEAYDFRMQKMRYVQKETLDIMAAIDLKQDHKILEIGTGTGELAVTISQYCSRVIALDTSLPMLEYARQKALKQGRGNIEFVHGGFLTYEHRRESLDGVITQLALHHLPDFWKTVALKRVSKMLKDGGKLFLRDVVFPSKVENYEVFFNELLIGLRTNAGEEIALETEIHIKEEYSTLDWIMEGMLRNAGFRIDEAAYYNGFLATYVCTKV